MSDEPGTNWERWYRQVLAAKAAAAAEPAPPNFRPTCLDCAYDLSGLEDGICPECGHGFTRERLVAAFNARIRLRQKRIGYLWHLPIFITFIPFFASFGVDGYVGFGINAVLFLLGASFWYAMNRDRFIEGAQWLLVLLVPLLSMGASIATAEHGMYGLVGVLAVMAAVSLAALQGSPLLSSIVLTVAFVVPLAGYSAMILLDSWMSLARGQYWSSFEFPAFPRWRAYTAAQAQTSGMAMFILSGVMGIGIAAVAKRARTRLQKRAELRAARGD